VRLPACVCVRVCVCVCVAPKIKEKCRPGPVKGLQNDAINPDLMEICSDWPGRAFHGGCFRAIRRNVLKLSAGKGQRARESQQDCVKTA